jgi:hypothetical protein
MVLKALVFSQKWALRTICTRHRAWQVLLIQEQCAASASTWRCAFECLSQSITFGRTSEHLVTMP